MEVNISPQSLIRRLYKVVKKERNLPDNVVAAGNPARVICMLDEYYEKRRNSELAEATEMVKEYYEIYNRVPH